MYCVKCGAQLPDDAAFCSRCGMKMSQAGPSSDQPAATASRPSQVIAPATATSLKCPSCAAPIAPKFGEMIITCEYCGSSITLGSSGWSNIQKQTMLPLKFASPDQLSSLARSMMDRGLLNRHLQESSTLQEMSLSIVPYWLVGVSARTSLVASDVVAEGATVATTAALFGVMAGLGGGGRRGGFGGPLVEGALLGSMMGGGMGGRGMTKAIQMNENYNYPIVGLKALTAYQPHDYQFALQDRDLFDISKYPKGIKVLNGDISEDAAKYQAKTLVDQLQSQKAHAKYHMIQQMNSQEDVSDTELLHAPIWFVRYQHKGNQIVLVLDANSGNVINSIGL
jgi:DNA-directed RNA polymerase subunit RPC12/RpoP